MTGNRDAALAPGRDTGVIVAAARRSGGLLMGAVPAGGSGIGDRLGRDVGADTPVGVSFAVVSAELHPAMAQMSNPHSTAT
ncbi:hypothetical protein [Austwickia sp. TVS 96-490-7B]|uniref:hypothetical protein n=1 Tax=Austwickia sp. TVS 96-490-7B TaxID=2830843 RepID=UPI001C55CF66|nr:hypothetical protein [Austwickia sp. TVS 96-490-7B]